MLLENINRRIVEVLNKLNLGKSVRFMDRRNGQMRVGKVVAIKGDQVTVHEDGTRSQWRLSYAGIDPGEDDERVESELPTTNESMQHKPARADFCRGDKVSFTDKYLQPQVGTITRINQRTATVDCEGGAGWRVPFAMLHHVMDI
jgi:FKBP-type peptidyl-prolyl cis-trans isomerase 2